MKEKVQGEEEFLSELSPGRMCAIDIQDFRNSDPWVKHKTFPIGEVQE